MKTRSAKYPATEWKKGETRSCPSGKCKHRHVRGMGPCIELGCGCHGGSSGIKRKEH